MEKGMPMGNKSSPGKADLIMDSLLDSVLQQTGSDVFFIKKYVDDLLLCLKSISH
jgi:hypothetical protein